MSLQRFVGFAALATGGGLIAAARVAGIDLTEGQQLAAYWHVYAAAVFLMLLGHKVMKVKP